LNSYATILKPAIDVVSKHHNTYACDFEPHRHIAIAHFEFILQRLKMAYERTGFGHGEPLARGTIRYFNETKPAKPS
jgi:hypothetical protein